MEIILMNLKQLPSVVEVYGPCYKSIILFCLEVCRDVESLWIEGFCSPTVKIAQTMEMNLDKIVLCKIDGFSRLSMLFSQGHLQKEIDKHKTKVIVLNCLEEYTNMHNLFLVACEILYFLKRLYIEHKIKAFIVTGERKMYKNGILYETSFMHSLKWVYSIPSIFFIHKKDPEDREIVATMKKPVHTPEVEVKVSISSRK